MKVKNFLNLDQNVFSLIYKATTIHYHSNIEYIGNTSCESKVRYRNHKNFFFNENKRNETALSHFIWSKGT